VADKRHTYSIRVAWTGNQGTGTSSYRAYSRGHEISAQGKTAIAGSSDPVFRGDAARWNPAELLIAALSACHQLWYLHLCADAGIAVVITCNDRADAEGRLKRPPLRRGNLEGRFDCRNAWANCAANTTGRRRRDHRVACGRKKSRGSAVDRARRHSASKCRISCSPSPTRGSDNLS
jgi:organic hydroperoxide reductase OsmC/OhrA